MGGNPQPLLAYSSVRDKIRNMQFLIGFLVSLLFLMLLAGVYGAGYEQGTHDGWWRAINSHSMYGIIN